MKLIYETHSTTVDNENGVATGWLPGELSARGAPVRRASWAGGGSDVDVVFSSDLRRAVQTVELAGLAAPALPGLAAAGVQLRRAERRAGGRARSARSSASHDPFPGGQSYDDVVELTRSFLADIKRWYDDQVVLVVAHSANRWALEHLLGSRAPDGGTDRCPVQLAAGLGVRVLAPEPRVEDLLAT